MANSTRFTGGVIVEGGLTVDELTLPGSFEIPMGATIGVGADAGTTVAITIQLTNGAGEDLATRASVFAYLSDDAAGDSIAGTAPDGGVAIGVDGLAIPVVANKAFQLVSEADGDIDLVVTESGADVWYLIVVLPTGELVASDAITFTA